MKTIFLWFLQRSPRYSIWRSQVLAFSPMKLSFVMIKFSLSRSLCTCVSPWKRYKERCFVRVCLSISEYSFTLWGTWLTFSFLSLFSVVIIDLLSSYSWNWFIQTASGWWLGVARQPHLQGNLPILRVLFGENLRQRLLLTLVFWGLQK